MKYPIVEYEIKLKRLMVYKRICLRNIQKTKLMKSKLS